MSVLNDILNSGIFKQPEPPRDAWALGTVTDAPSESIGWTVAGVLLDGDTDPTIMRYGCPCGEGDRVVVLLLGRSRIVMANLDNWVPT